MQALLNALPALALFVAVVAFCASRTPDAPATAPQRPVVASSDENPVAVAADIATSLFVLVGLAFWLAVFIAPFAAIVWWVAR
jgi:hypothetical protein